MATLVTKYDKAVQDCLAKDAKMNQLTDDLVEISRENEQLTKDVSLFKQQNRSL